MTGLVEAVALGLVIGAVLGGLGGGGAILTVPALVYVLGQSPVEATTGSLVIVGLTAAVGVAAHLRSRRVEWRTGLLMGALGLPATWVGSLLNRRVDPDVLLLGFAALMVLAAAAMLPRRRPAAAVPTPARVADRVAVGAGTPLAANGSADHGPDRRPDPSPDASPDASPDPCSGRRPEPAPRRTSRVATVAAALGVGLLTGFFGVGGGFVVVPALVVVLGLPMPLAVGTSLLVVVLNSATSLLARVGQLELDWSAVVPFTLAAMAATFGGKRLADRVPAERTRAAFAALLVLVAGYTAWQSVDGLVAADPSPTTATSTSGTTAPVDVAAARAALTGGAVAIDVRTPQEYAAGHVAGAVNLDLSSPTFREDVEALDPDARYVVYCASGRRAAEAIAVMDETGTGRSLVNGGGLDDLVAVGVPTWRTGPTDTPTDNPEETTR